MPQYYDLAAVLQTAIRFKKGKKITPQNGTFPFAKFIYVKAPLIAKSRLMQRLDGADNQIRTDDLFLTKEVLCLLSYISKVATRKGLEPSTSSVTG